MQSMKGALQIGLVVMIAASSCRTDPGSQLEPELPEGQGGIASGEAGTGGATTGGSVAPPATTVVVGGPPPECTTADGSPGIRVDTFPRPPVDPVCEALAQPGVLDPQCPKERLLRCGLDDCLGVAEVPGCCRPNGECGLWDEGFWAKGKGLGCISREPWIENTTWLGGERARVACTPP